MYKSRYLLLAVITAVTFLGAGHVYASEASTISVPPALISPANAKQTNNTTPLFSWKAVSGASYYQIQISKSSTFSTISQTSTKSASQLTYTATTMSQGKYYWRVRAKDANRKAGPWSTVRSLIIDTKPPATPALSAPADGATRRFCTDTYSWSTPSTAFRYQIQFDSHSDFSAPIYTSATLSSPSFTEPGSTWTWVTNSQTGTYYWRVRASDKAGNWSNWSTGWQITFADQLFSSPPTLTSPPDGSTIHTATPTFTWNNAKFSCGIYGEFTIGDAISYEVQVADNADFNSPIWSNSTNAGGLNVQYLNFNHYVGTGNVKFYDLLKNNTQYYWRVRATNRQNEHSTWTTGSFTYVEDGSACSPLTAGPITYNFNWGSWTLDSPALIKMQISEFVPAVGDSQTVILTFTNSYNSPVSPLQSVKVSLVTDHAVNDPVDFNLISGDYQNGVWQGILTVPETYCYQYMFDVEAATATAPIPFVIVNRQP